MFATHEACVQHMDALAGSEYRRVSVSTGTLIPEDLMVVFKEARIKVAYWAVAAGAPIQLDDDWIDVGLALEAYRFPKHSTSSAELIQGLTLLTRIAMKLSEILLWESHYRWELLADPTAKRRNYFSHSLATIVYDLETIKHYEPWYTKSEPKSEPVRKTMLATVVHLADWKQNRAHLRRVR
jgi:hypothetical protein